MPFLILLVGQWLMRALPRAAGILLKMPLLVAGIAIAVSTLLACTLVTNSIYDSLSATAAAWPDAWCIATAFGVNLGLYWMMQGLTVGIGVITFKALREPILLITAELGKVMQ